MENEMFFQLSLPHFSPLAFIVLQQKRSFLLRPSHFFADGYLRVDLDEKSSSFLQILALHSLCYSFTDLVCIHHIQLGH